MRKIQIKNLLLTLLIPCFLLGPISVFAIEEDGSDDGGGSKEVESIECKDSKGNLTGYGSKCITGSCNCTPNKC